MKILVPFLAGTASAHGLAAWNFSRWHVIGAGVTLAVLIAAGWIAWRRLNRPYPRRPPMPSRSEWAEVRRRQREHWDRVYRGGPR